MSPVVPLVPTPGPPEFGGLYGGFEAVVVKPYKGNVSVPLIPILSIPPDFGYEFTPRVWVGYEFPQGFGPRVTWWRFDSDGVRGAAATEFTDPNSVGALASLLGFDPNYDTLSSQGTLVSRLKLNSIDAEFVQAGRFSNWNWSLSGGVRYATIESTESVSLNLTFSDLVPPNTPPLPDASLLDFAAAVTEKYEGVGPTIAFSGQRPLGFWEGLGFFADARMSFLFGETTSNLTVTLNTPGMPIPLAQTNNQVVQVWEARVGVDWTRILTNGAIVRIGAAFEGQAWEWSPPVFSTGSDLGFAGPTGFVEIKI